MFDGKANLQLVEEIQEFAQLISISSSHIQHWRLQAKNTQLCPNTLDGFWSVAALPPIETELKKQLISRINA